MGFTVSEPSLVEGKYLCITKDMSLEETLESIKEALDQMDVNEELDWHIWKEPE